MRPTAPLTPEETVAWIERYQRNSRIYAWGFFAVLIVVVFIVIRVSMGEWNADVFYSWAFFVVVTFLLAVWTRRKAKKTWRGRVVEKVIRQRRVRDQNQQGHTETVYTHCVLVRTSRGKKETLRVSPNLYSYYEEGDELVKTKGFDWPEKVTLKPGLRVCLACGGVLQLPAHQCPRCRAPVPDHTTLVELAPQ